MGLNLTVVYFAGQDGFGNRGCEALIRSSVKTIRQYIPDAAFLIPSRNAHQDLNQWPDSDKYNVTFIPAEPIPSVIRWWSRARRFLKMLDGMPPAYQVSESTCKAILSSDVLVMTGGDIISLDYGLESLYYWTQICELAMDAGIPSVLWAGSIGPFSSVPSAEARMKVFLKRFSLITVRETETLKYMHDLGIENVELVTDSAFALEIEPAPINTIAFFQSDAPVLGFNVSSLIRKFRDTEEAKDALDIEIIDFLVDVLRKGDFNVMLIPHVDPLDGSVINSDSAYMHKILQKVRANGFNENQIDILPATLNASQLKAVIRKCAYFMGARTHATVAALSQGVPTTSIAYSVKAKGINQDLFGHTNYVLETPMVTAKSLKQHFAILIKNRQQIKVHLAKQLPDWKLRSEKSAALLAKLLCISNTNGVGD